jgi:putative PEP-CTERM system histidine kinase
MSGTIAVFSYTLAATAFVAISLLLSTRWRGRPYGRTLLLACVLSAAWAACCVLRIAEPQTYALLADLGEIARNAGWTGLLLMLLTPAGSRATTPSRIAFASLYTLLLTITLLSYASDVPQLNPLGALAVLAGRIVASVMGLLFVEQLFVNSSSEDRWGVKFACLGIGALFLYDFYMYSDALLFRKLDVEIWTARGVINALIVPLIAVSVIRAKRWAPRIAVSRRILFHSAAISASALYLLVMAAAGYYLRYFGGSWGAVMQAALVFAALALLAMVLVSGTFRAWLKVFISKHFYNYNYDYREEWMGFTRTLSEPGPDLERRAVRAVASLVESPAGVLFMRTEAGPFLACSGWNAALPEAVEPPDTPFVRLLEDKHWVIDLEQAKQGEHAVALPAWLAGLPEAWLVVPLMLQADLAGFIVLSAPRSRIQLDWEVLDLLKIAGSQAAGNLAQKRVADALLVARQFESYNRMSTFVVHDLKNLVSQLSLLVANAERHGGSPEFQKDMLETVQHATNRMKLVLQKFRRDGAPDRVAPVSLEQSVREAMKSKAAGLPRPQLSIGATPLLVRADPARLERVIGHLIQNAMEATPRDGRIDIALSRLDARAVLELADTGSGMSEEFIRERLFRPFESTKLAGMGIGVFESREYVRELGGTLEVSSTPGAGTRFRITLPLHADIAPAQASPTQEIVHHG